MEWKAQVKGELKIRVEGRRKEKDLVTIYEDLKYHLRKEN